MLSWIMSAIRSSSCLKFWDRVFLCSQQSPNVALFAWPICFHVFPVRPLLEGKKKKNKNQLVLKQGTYWTPSHPPSEKKKIKLSLTDSKNAFPKYAVSSFKGPFVYFQEETQDSWKPEGIWGEWDYSAGWIQRQAGPSLPELWSCFVSRPSPHPLNTFTDKLARSSRVIWLWVHHLHHWGDGVFTVLGAGFSPPGSGFSAFRASCFHSVFQSSQK